MMVFGCKLAAPDALVWDGEVVGDGIDRATAGSNGSVGVAEVPVARA